MKNAATIPALCFASFFLGRYSIIVKPISQSLPTATQQEQQLQIPTTGKPISDAQYQQIKEGMTVAQVEAILGKGQKGSETEAMGNVYVGYIWSWQDNTGYHVISITFVNGVSSGVKTRM